jgi:hypothetical protein
MEERIMANREVSIETSKEISQQPRVNAVASRGVRTTADLADLASGLISDLIEGKISPAVASNVIASGNLLVRTAEFQMRFQPNVNEAALLTGR